MEKRNYSQKNLYKFKSLPYHSIPIPEGKTLIFHDPDAVAMNKATETYIHWASSGLPYIPPSPPQGTGVHHYTYALVDIAPISTGVVKKNTMGKMSAMEEFRIDSGVKGGSWRKTRRVKRKALKQHTKKNSSYQPV